MINGNGYDILIETWPTEEYPDGHRCILKIDHQQFIVGRDHENREEATWMGEQLDIALKRLLSRPA